MVNISQKVGLKIKKMREERKLTQEEVAFRSKLDYSYLNQVENGKRNPSVETLGKIAKTLGVPVKELFD